MFEWSVESAGGVNRELQQQHHLHSGLLEVQGRSGMKDLSMCDMTHSLDLRDHQDGKDWFTFGH